MAQLDDRLLRDIGLTRLQIHGAAFGLLRLGPCASPLGAPPPSAPAGGERPKRRVSAARLDQAASRRWPAAQRAGRCAGAAASIGED
jgi:hypothetical protein